jgi:hypothetical protein
MQFVTVLIVEYHFLNGRRVEKSWEELRRVEKSWEAHTSIDNLYSSKFKDILYKKMWANSKLLTNFLCIVKWEKLYYN